MNRVILFIMVATSIIALVGCASVTVTKTGRGTYPATVPDQIEVLMTKPDRSYEELASISVTGWNPAETAKMHNALRTKSAPLGADAVILINSGIDANNQLWGTGVAIRWNR